jgi:hypothetical protein
MFDWSLAGDWLGGSGLHDAQDSTLSVLDHDSYMLSQTVPRHLYPLAALERPQGLAYRDSLRLESADSYTHHGITSIRKVFTCLVELTKKTRDKAILFHTDRTIDSEGLTIQ